MRDAAHEAIFFAKDRSRDEFARDRMLLLSLVKELEIMGKPLAEFPECIEGPEAAQRFAATMTKLRVWSILIPCLDL
jgi:hypothetical protein